MPGDHRVLDAGHYIVRWVFPCAARSPGFIFRCQTFRPVVQPLRSCSGHCGPACQEAASALPPLSGPTVAVVLLARRPPGACPWLAGLACQSRWTCPVQVPFSPCQWIVPRPPLLFRVLCCFCLVFCFLCLSPCTCQCAVVNVLHLGFRHNRGSVYICVLWGSLGS